MSSLPRLVGVELTRLRWRRAVVVLLLLVVAATAATAALRIWDTRPISDERRAEVAQSRAVEIAACVKTPLDYGAPEGATTAQCTDAVASWERSPLDLRSEIDGSGLLIITMLGLALLLAGATFAGHDHITGSMSNQLLFEPRRGRLWSAKVLAVGLLALVAALAVQTAFWLTLWAVARERGLPRGDALSVALLQDLRGTGVVVGCAIGGFALTTLLRSTVATLGVLFAVVTAAGLFMGIVGIDGRWAPDTNMIAIVENGTTYYIDVPDRCYQAEASSDDTSTYVVPPECVDSAHLSAWHGVGYWGAASVLVGAASVLTFRRRDVA